MANILRSGILLFFGLWFLLTLITQIKGRVRYRLKGWDVLGLIPIWSFFAPRPSNSDMHLLFRDLGPSGVWGPWNPVETIPPRRVYHLLWNPRRRPHAALINLWRDFPVPARPADVQKFKHSVAYRAIQNLVMHLPPLPEATARQFCVMSARRPPKGEVRRLPVFLSERFCLAEAGRRTEEPSSALRLTLGCPSP
jgi:hypothetical protein